MKSLKSNKNDKNFVYCGNRKCPYTECIRHNMNTPWNVMILREVYQLDKDLQCKHKII